MAGATVKMMAEKGLTISIAESCIGGLTTSMLTDVSGASLVVLGSIVAYSNNVKTDILKVKKSTLMKHGAVSKETALEMVRGVNKFFESDISVSITGIAGPTGGTKEKPVGTVFLAIKHKKEENVIHLKLTSPKYKTRKEIKKESAKRAIIEVNKLVKKL